MGRSLLIHPVLLLPNHPLLLEQGFCMPELEGNGEERWGAYAIKGMLQGVALDGNASATVEDLSPAFEPVFSESCQIGKVLL